jgi:hypothetical protein
MSVLQLRSEQEIWQKLIKAVPGAAFDDAFAGWFCRDFAAPRGCVLEIDSVDFDLQALWAYRGWVAGGKWMRKEAGGIG